MVLGLEHLALAPQGLPGVVRVWGGVLRRSGRGRAAVAPAGVGLDRRALAQAHEASPRWSICPPSRRAPCLGWPVAVAQACPSRRGPVWWRSSRRRRLSQTTGAPMARRAEPGGQWGDAGGSRGCAAGVPPASADGVRSGVALCGGLPRAQGAGVSRSEPVWRLPCVSHVRRGRAVRGPRGVPQAGVPWGQLGLGKPGVGGAAGPNNALEPTAPMVAFTHSASLVARRLTAGVRSGAAGLSGLVGSSGGPAAWERRGAPGAGGPPCPLAAGRASQTPLGCAVAGVLPGWRVRPGGVPPGAPALPSACTGRRGVGRGACGGCRGPRRR